MASPQSSPESLSDSDVELNPNSSLNPGATAFTFPVPQSVVAHHELDVTLGSTANPASTPPQTQSSPSLSLEHPPDGEDEEEYEEYEEDAEQALNGSPPINYTPLDFPLPDGHLGPSVIPVISLTEEEITNTGQNVADMGGETAAIQQYLQTETTTIRTETIVQTDPPSTPSLIPAPDLCGRSEAVKRAVHWARGGAQFQEWFAYQGSGDNITIEFIFRHAILSQVSDVIVHMTRDYIGTVEERIALFISSVFCEPPPKDKVARVLNHLILDTEVSGLEFRAAQVAILLENRGEWGVPGQSTMSLSDVELCPSMRYDYDLTVVGLLLLLRQHTTLRPTRILVLNLRRIANFSPSTGELICNINSYMGLDALWASPHSGCVTHTDCFNLQVMNCSVIPSHTPERQSPGWLLLAMTMKHHLRLDVEVTDSAVLREAWLYVNDTFPDVLTAMSRHITEILGPIVMDNPSHVSTEYQERLVVENNPLSNLVCTAVWSLNKIMAGARLTKTSFVESLIINEPAHCLNSLALAMAEHITPWSLISSDGLPGEFFHNDPAPPAFQPISRNVTARDARAARLAGTTSTATAQNPIAMSSAQRRIESRTAHTAAPPPPPISEARPEPGPAEEGRSQEQWEQMAGLMAASPPVPSMDGVTLSQLQGIIVALQIRVTVLETSIATSRIDPLFERVSHIEATAAAERGLMAEHRQSIVHLLNQATTDPPSHAEARGPYTRAPAEQPLNLSNIDVIKQILSAGPPSQSDVDTIRMGLAAHPGILTGVSVSFLASTRARERLIAQLTSL